MPNSSRGMIVLNVTFNFFEYQEPQRIANSKLSFEVANYKKKLMPATRGPQYV